MQLEEQLLPACVCRTLTPTARLRDGRLAVLAVVNALGVRQHHHLWVTEETLPGNAVVETLGLVGDGSFCASPEPTCARLAGPCLRKDRDRHLPRALPLNQTLPLPT